VHGFLTVDGEKMSKRRGTFITAATYAKHLDPDYLRYYFASKLGPTADDIDLNFDDFIAKVNADLVGKLVNIASRCAGFIHRLNDGQLSEHLADDALYHEFSRTAADIAADYESRNFARAIRRIMRLADRANQYIDDQKPWLNASDPEQHDSVVAVCTLGLNLFRTLIVLLKPVIPAVAERSERFLACGEMEWDDVAKPLLGHRIERFEPLLKRVERDAVKLITEETRSGEPTVASDSTNNDEIDIDLFSKIDLRVAHIVAAGYVEGADKLLELKLDIGESERVVFAGIRSAYDPAALVGRHVVVVANLKPRKMRFGTSQGMVLAAGPGGEDIFLVSPDKGAQPGMRVR
jgi:methionyl-tRNA synthetase